MPRPSNLRRPLLCYVTDRRSLAEGAPAPTVGALLRTVRAAAEVGLDWIQIREKGLSAKDLARVAQEAQRYAAESSVGREIPSRIIVNDRFDVAIAVRSGGVHLGENSLPVADAKRLLQNSSLPQLAIDDFLIGVSCHSLETAKSAARDGADYIFFGPIFATPSKAAFGQPQGLERLAEVCASVSVPVLAIGGITLENTSLCFASGASGIAAIRLFQDVPGLPRLVEALRNLAF